MKVIRRIIKSYINNIGDKLYLTLVMVILLLSFILSLFIYNYSSNTINHLRNNIKPIVAIKSIYNDVKYQPNNKKIYAYSDFEENIDLINKHIEYINYLGDKYHSNYTSMNAYNDITNNIVGYSDEYDFLYSDVLDESKFKTNTSDFKESINPFLKVVTLSSESNEVPSKVYFDDAKIIKGRTFNQDELDEAKNVIILPGEILKYTKDNKTIDIGDYVSFAVLSNGYNGLNIANGEFRNHKTYEFEVIGFMDGISVRNESNPKAIIPSKLYMDIIKESSKILALENPDYYFLYSTSSKNSDIGKHNTSNIMKFYPSVMELNSVKDLELLYEEIDNYNNNNGNIYELESDLDHYKYLETNFVMIKTVVGYIIAFSFILSMIIYGLVIINDIRKRNKEIGILIAIGESKINIIIQLIIEYFANVIISLILALIISYPIKSMIIDVIYNSYNNEMLSNNYLNNDIMSEIIIDINLSIEEFMMIGTIGVFVLFVAVIPLIIMIYNHKPKIILDGE